MEHLVQWLDGSLGFGLADGPGSFNLLDELLSEDWLEASLQPSTSSSTSPFNYSSLSPLTDISNNTSNPSLQKNSEETQKENLDAIFSFSPNTTSVASFQSVEPDTVHLSSSLWSQPRHQISSITERLINALRYIKECQRDGAVLVQLWVPIERGDQQVLTTCGQPFELDPNCDRLVNYRMISTNYHFLAKKNSSETVGLPGRVFLGKLPEWTPDVRYYSSYEYARVDYAQLYDVRATLALPVFERGSRSCLGVVEIVMTSEKIHYTSDIEKICKVLQAVDLTSSEITSSAITSVPVSNDSYQADVPEILEILRTACETHRLPLAQAWILCSQQGKIGYRHSNENFKDCISTVDDACYVKDLSMLGFHEACSEHHLLRGQGVVGKAFTTNQPCFSPDITSFSKGEYPLSHHARMFHLRAAVAIRLRSIHNRTFDFVLEFILPIECKEREEQKLVLHSLSITLQKVCRSLRVVTAMELKDEALLQVNEPIPSTALFEKSVQTQVQKLSGELKEQHHLTAMGLEDEALLQVNEPIPSTALFEKSVQTHTQKLSGEFKEQHHQDSMGGDHNSSFSRQASFSEFRKDREIWHTKPEKNISLQVLQQHFSGSLRDAANSLGVCPTTLKRICRQHGIARWPSRKLKNVDHSLKKLQVIIDSVQDAEGAFQISSLYTNLEKVSASDEKVSVSCDLSALNQNVHSDSLNGCQEQEGRYSKCTSSASSISPSSCNQSSSSSLCCSTGTKQHAHPAQLATKQEAPKEENQNGRHKRAARRVGFNLSTNEELGCLVRLKSHKSLGKHPSSENLLPLDKNISGLFKVKAMYGEEKVRFRLQPNWGLHELKQEVAKRFNISNMSLVRLKYLDDDSEWVLLTCNADLQECIDVFRSSNTDTIRISVQHAHPSTLASSSNSLPLIERISTHQDNCMSWAASDK